MIQLEGKIDGGIARPVAIKILHDTYRLDVELMKKFRREAKLAARSLHRARCIKLRGGENDSANLERTI